MRSKGLTHKRILHWGMSEAFVPRNRPILIDVSISIKYSNHWCRGGGWGCVWGQGPFHNALRRPDGFLLRWEARWDLEWITLICTFCVCWPIDTDISFIKPDLHVSLLTKAENKKGGLMRRKRRQMEEKKNQLWIWKIWGGGLGLDGRADRIPRILPAEPLQGFTQGLKAFNQNNPLQTTRP